MSVRGHAACDTAGTGVTWIGWNDQNARCSGVMTYAGPAGVERVGLLPDATGDAPVAVGLGAKAGHGAPAFTQSVSASISDALKRPPFGILRAVVCRTARISRLFSGSPGTIAGPDLPPLRSASRESSRRPPIFSSAWQS